MVIATVAVVALALAPRMKDRNIVYDIEPDQPCSFGYKMAWIAVRTKETGAVLAALDMTDVVAANWQSGLGTVYHEELGENRIFVSPPVRGWTFVVGLALPHPLGPRFVDKWTPLMELLAAEFSDLQYYFTYPLIDFYAWARVLKGRISRVFAIGDEGVILKRGRLSAGEKSLGLQMFELRGVRGLQGDAGGELLLYPTETHVMELAGQWGLDPTRLASMDGEPGVGAIGFAPSYWRPEVLRQAA